jgi:hypothetical protein
MFRRVALVRTDVPEEFIASIFRVERISELGTTLTVTGNTSAYKRRAHLVKVALKKSCDYL